MCSSDLHNVFLALKEALHNVLKHAGATEVRFSVELSPAGFAVVVADNGRGFVWLTTGPGTYGAGEQDRASAGNGLANIRKRMDEIGGSCAWNTAPGEGTRLRFGVVVKSEARQGAPSGPTLAVDRTALPGDVI